MWVEYQNSPESRFKAETSWPKRVSNPGLLGPESYALPLRHTDSAFYTAANLYYAIFRKSSSEAGELTITKSNMITRISDVMVLF